MEFKLIGAPIALYKIFSTGAEKAPIVIQKELNLKFPILQLKGLTQNKANIKIGKKATQIFDSGKKLLFIGGDHSITFPILNAYKGRPFDVFWFDAHPDAYDFYKHKYSHATVLRRVAELPRCKNIYLIGNRIREEEEKVYLRTSKKVKRIHATDVKNIHSPRYYVTIDLDVLDPLDAPAVDHAEPRGLRLKDLISAIRNLKKGNLIGADLVEFVPDNDSSGVTEKSISNILSEFLNNKLST